MYDMESLIAEGFTIYVDNQLGVLIKYLNKPLFLTGIMPYNYKENQMMLDEALTVFSEWIVHCINTNDIEWWLEERIGGTT